jgi:hypothetical protein
MPANSKCKELFVFILIGIVVQPYTEPHIFSNLLVFCFLVFKPDAWSTVLFWFLSFGRFISVNYEI